MNEKHCRAYAGYLRMREKVGARQKRFHSPSTHEKLGLLSPGRDSSGRGGTSGSGAQLAQRATPGTLAADASSAAVPATIITTTPAGPPSLAESSATLTETPAQERVRWAQYKKYK